MRLRSGLTLAELLIVLGIAAIPVVAIGHFAVMGRLERAAEGVARELRASRTLAVVAGVGVPTCLYGTVAPHTGTTLAWPTLGLAFGADGLPRTCDGGGVGNTTILLEHRGQQAAVIVSSLGRVRWEMR